MQPSQPSNVHIPPTLTNDSHNESFVIKRRHMTFAQAEKERNSRIIQLALLSAGDIIGLESYVCDLATHMNSARCTGSCDLFYILKHNFLRLHKRHGAQGLSERLRETVVLSLQAYPQRVMQLPLFTSLMKRQLAPPLTDEQAQFNAKQSWLSHSHTPNQSVCFFYCLFLKLLYYDLYRVHVDQIQKHMEIIKISQQIQPMILEQINNHLNRLDMKLHLQ